jgi:hypothetical protein
MLNRSRSNNLNKNSQQARFLQQHEYNIKDFATVCNTQKGSHNTRYALGKSPTSKEHSIYYLQHQDYDTISK